MRKLIRYFLLFLLNFLMLIALGFGYLHYQFRQLPVEQLSYQISQFNLRDIRFQYLQFKVAHNAYLYDVRLSELSLNWQWRGKIIPELTLLSLQQGEIDLHPDTAQTAIDNEVDNSGFNLPATWQLPDWLPASMTIDQLLLKLPCYAKQCQYSAALSLQRNEADNNWQFDLQASSGSELKVDQQLHLTGNYVVEENLPALTAYMLLGKTLSVTVHNQLQSAEQLIIHGNASVTLSPLENWVSEQLQHWNITIPAKWSEQFTQRMQISSHWHWSIPDEVIFSDALQQTSGNWFLQAALPSPLLLPGVGWLQGNLETQLTLEQGDISAYQLQSELQLQQPVLPQMLIDAGINPGTVSIKINADETTAPQLTALPIRLSVSTEGETTFKSDTKARISITEPYSLQLQQTEFSLQQDSVLKPVEDVVLHKVRASGKLNAAWQNELWQLAFLPETRFSAGFSYQDLKTDSISADFNQFTLSGDTRFTDIKTEIALAAELNQLQHPLLKTQNWQWQFNSHGDLQQQILTGTLSNDAGITLPHQLRYQPEEILLDWQLTDIFLLAGNPLANTFTSWPELLELNRGRLSATGKMSLDKNNKLHSENTLQLSGISGIYDRSLFQGLSAQLDLQLAEQQFDVHTENLIIDNIQHGFNLGPLQLAAAYQAILDAPLQGKVVLEQLSIAAMGGEISSSRQQLDFSQPQQELLIQLNKIELAQLLRQYPSTEINGEGRLHGMIPLQFDKSGVHIAAGTISAEAPGGYLQYQPENAAAMAAGNASMKMVLDAMQNFHYSVLSSDVSYDTTGKLLLALQLQGKNPALDNTPAINFSITLEEDLPAMIASIQLSSQISDKIKQRIQQRLQQKRDQ